MDDVTDLTDKIQLIFERHFGPAIKDEITNRVVKEIVPMIEDAVRRVAPGMIEQEVVRAIGDTYEK